MIFRRSTHGGPRAGPAASIAVVAVAGLSGVLAAACAASRPPSGTGLLGQEQALLYRLSRCGKEKCKKQKGALGRKLERVRYQKSIRAGTVYALKRYLGRYPKGQFRAEVHSRLARQRFERAKGLGTAWAWQWFLTHHGDSKQAEAAQRALERELIRELRKNPQEAKLRDFLRRFPDSNLRHEALNLLSEIRFRQLKGSTNGVQLEFFLRLFPKSARAPEVRRRLERLWRKRVALLGGWEALEAYLARYPKSTSRAALTRKVARSAAAEATLDLDPDSLSLVVKKAPDLPVARAAASLLKAIRKRPADAEKIRKLSHAVRPYRPRVRLRALVAAAGGDNLHTARTALRSLSYYGVPRALETLVHMVGAGHLGLSPVAWLSLKEWFRRTAAGPASMMAAELMSRLGPRTRNPSDALRVAALARVSGSNSKTIGRWLARARKGRVRRLVALAVEFSGKRLSDGVRSTAAFVYVRTVRDKMRELARAFPATVSRANLTGARMMVFHLASVAELARHTAGDITRLGLMTPALGRQHEEALHKARFRLKAFDLRLAKVSAAHMPVGIDSVRVARQRHEKGRAQAWHRLRTARGILAARVQRVLCRRPGLLPPGTPRKDCKGK